MHGFGLWNTNKLYAHRRCRDPTATLPLPPIVTNTETPALTTLHLFTCNREPASSSLHVAPAAKGSRAQLCHSFYSATISFPVVSSG